MAILPERRSPRGDVALPGSRELINGKVVTMEGSHGTCGGSRRRFLKTAAATVAGGAMASADMSLVAAAPTFPTITLRKTGQVLTRLGMGTSRHVQPSFGHVPL